MPHSPQNLIPPTSSAPQLPQKRLVAAGAAAIAAPQCWQNLPPPDAMVNSNTYRNPCLTAKMAATLDHTSGGRLNLGLGAGWYSSASKLRNHFKTLGGRLRALDESCQIIKGMFTQEQTSLDGKHYKVVDAVCNPKPLQKPHIPIIIGGRGEKELLKIVAKHADQWNTMFANPAEMKRLIAVIERHGDTVGRDTDEIEKTIMLPLCYKASKDRKQMIAAPSLQLRASHLSKRAIAS